jgi:hypothetical protein
MTDSDLSEVIDQWTNRALDAEAEVERLKTLLADSESEVDARIQERQDETRKKREVSHLYGGALRELERVKADRDRVQTAYDTAMNNAINEATARQKAEDKLEELVDVVEEFLSSDHPSLQQVALVKVRIVVKRLKEMS